MAQQERAIRTRKVVLDAAGAVFAELGYSATTIAEILQRAGVTKGALYFHFPSKQDLARGVIEQAVTEPPREEELILQSFVDMGLELAYRLPREPVLRGAARLAADQGAPEFFGTPWPRWASRGEELLNRAKATGEVLPHVDAAVTSRLLVGSFTGLQLVAQSQAGAESFQELISRLYDHVLPAVALPGVLMQLDTSAERGALLAERRPQEQEAVS